MKRNVPAYSASSCSMPNTKEFTAPQIRCGSSQRLEKMPGGKQFGTALLVILWAAGITAAQVTSPTEDVLGAHNVYGRGCLACHTPHNGAPENLARPSRTSGRFALWGQDLSPHYATSVASGSNLRGAYMATLPDNSRGGFPSASGSGYLDLIACLSCHDGNLAQSDMMKGTTVETVSIAGITFNPPTFVGNEEATIGSYMNSHPVGPSATIACGGKKEWDCTVNADGSITFAGPKGRAFIADYLDVTREDGPLNHLVKVPGSTVNGTTVNSKSWITCTTCHDQHDMPYFSTPSGAVKPTRFFVRGWYNPGSSATSNSAAQFCRSCHADKSNEAKGRMVPTT